MEKAERYNYVFDQYDGDSFIYDLKEDKRIEYLSECADILNKKEKEIERWFEHKKFDAQVNMDCFDKIEELEARLSNCIEPKFIYGQYVWCVYPENEHRKGFVFKMDFVGYTKDKIICCINENEEFDYDMVFATEAEAKVKLEDLKNG